MARPDRFPRMALLTLVAHPACLAPRRPRARFGPRGRFGVLGRATADWMVPRFLLLFA